MTDVLSQIGGHWNAAAATYKQAPGHHPQTPLEWAAWRGLLAGLLPPGPSRVLDVGAGTGILSLAAAQLGHVVTALDLSPSMLQVLHTTAASDGLKVEVIHGRADEPPSGPFDVVMSRHLLWTLPDPLAALRAWRAVCPDGRLLLVESLWAGPRTRLSAYGSVQLSGCASCVVVRKAMETTTTMPCARVFRWLTGRLKR